MPPTYSPRAITAQCIFEATCDGIVNTYKSNPVTFYSTGNTGVIKRIGRSSSCTYQEIYYPKRTPLYIVYEIRLDSCILGECNYFFLEDILFCPKIYTQSFRSWNTNIYINGIEKNYLYRDHTCILIPSQELTCNEQGECYITIESIIMYCQSTEQPAAFQLPSRCSLIMKNGTSELSLPVTIIGSGRIIDQPLYICKFVRSQDLLDADHELRTYQIVYCNMCPTHSFCLRKGCIATRIAKEERIISISCNHRLFCYDQCIRYKCSFPIYPQHTFSFYYQTIYKKTFNVL